MSNSSTLSTEVIVTLILGVPSLLFTATGAWIAYLAYIRPREPYASTPATHTIPALHAHHHYHLQHLATDSRAAERRGSLVTSTDEGPSIPQLVSYGSPIRRRATGDAM
ncbi:hypothetical protein PG997_011765 [Apiospora hydei]|uniref:Uncharacterized protein n=1 Tax=Apiospora hydei TaxID=1337664 RepID=A0ABR1V1I7_9PEZI